MNRAEKKYAVTMFLAPDQPGVVKVVAVEHNTIYVIRRCTKYMLKRWYLVLSCRAGNKTWFGKLATTGKVARAVKTTAGQ